MTGATEERRLWSAVKREAGLYSHMVEAIVIWASSWYALSACERRKHIRSSAYKTLNRESVVTNYTFRLFRSHNLVTFGGRVDSWRRSIGWETFQTPTIVELLQSMSYRPCLGRLAPSNQPLVFRAVHTRYNLIQFNQIIRGDCDQKSRGRKATFQNELKGFDIEWSVGKHDMQIESAKFPLGHAFKKLLKSNPMNVLGSEFTVISWYESTNCWAFTFYILWLWLWHCVISISFDGLFSFVPLYGIVNTL